MNNEYQDIKLNQLRYQSELSEETSLLELKTKLVNNFLSIDLGTMRIELSWNLNYDQISIWTECRRYEDVHNIKITNSNNLDTIMKQSMKLVNLK